MKARAELACPIMSVFLGCSFAKPASCAFDLKENIAIA